MIRVKRPEIAPSSLEKKYGDRVKPPKIPGKTETEAVIQRYSQHLVNSPSKPFKFKYERYSDREVNAALRKLFNGKCAYCESRYASTQPMDVEHWRPKGEILGRDKKSIKPGYYWLAADWENLLPSCIDCNRGRTQFDKLENKEIVLGKKNQFPLADPTNRILKPDVFNAKGGESETPLLINPCIEDPEEFFLYDEQGLILPKSEDENSLEHKRAMASIRVYALNRADLVADRSQMILSIDHRLNLIDRLGPIQNKLAKLSDAEPDKDWDISAEAIADLIAAEMDVLLNMQKSERPFAGLARQFIGETSSS